jgi:hypothetical protein
LAQDFFSIFREITNLRVNLKEGLSVSKKANQKSKVKVLYQNLGGIWYAFAQNGEDMYFGRVPLNVSPEDAFELLRSQNPVTQKAGKTTTKTSRKLPQKDAA